MKKVIFIFGTRPEAIKMVPIINRFKKDTVNFKTFVCVTAQHREMLDQVLSLFKIVPDYDLNLMSPNQSLEKLTSNILLGLDDILLSLNPDIVFVQGDTTTTFTTALACYYKQIPVAHIEAGLRTNDIYSPFPEEVNRRLTTSIAEFHFPPTKKSKENLLNEGISEDKISLTGNTGIDTLLKVSSKIDVNEKKYNKLFFNDFGISFNNSKTILITGHRRENFGQGLNNIFKAIKKIAMNNNLQFIYPLHLNPNVIAPAKRILGNLKNVFLIPPQDYLPFIFLMKKSHIILTDSGGVQEEAPSLGKPILVMRDKTERPEGVEAGTAKIVGTDMETIISSIDLLIKNNDAYNNMSKAANPYGDGKASVKIYNYIKGKLI